MKFDDLKDFVECYNPQNRFKRKETERFKKFKYDEIIARDKTNLDIFWLKDDSLGDMDNLPDPDVLALEIVENIEAGLASFKEIVEGLNGKYQIIPRPHTLIEMILRWCGSDTVKSISLKHIIKFNLPFNHRINIEQLFKKLRFYIRNG